jgi:hypothetical protein
LNSAVGQISRPTIAQIDYGESKLAANIAQLTFIKVTGEGFSSALAVAGPLSMRQGCYQILILLVPVPTCKFNFAKQLSYPHGKAVAIQFEYPACVSKSYPQGVWFYRG